MKPASLRMRMVLVAAVVSSGVIAGVVAPQRSEAGVAYLGMHTHGGSPVMGHGRWEISCGWHDICFSGQYDSGLGMRGVDWATAPTPVPVYWRSKNYRSDVYSLWTGEVRTTFEQPFCSSTVRGRVTDRWGGVRGAVLYLHTQLLGGVPQTFDFYAGNGAWVDEEGNGGTSWALVPTTDVHIGSTVADGPGCWAGYHLHQQADDDQWPWTDNKQSPPAGIPYAPGTDMLNSVWDKPQAWTQWQVSW